MSLEETRILIASHNLHANYPYGNGIIDNQERIIRCINHEDNKNGEFYKNHFDKDIEGQEDYNPKGNNILLLTISRAGFAMSNKESASLLAQYIIEDAKAKLSEGDFIKFIDYKPTGTYDYFENNAMNLSIIAKVF